MSPSFVRCQGVKLRWLGDGVVIILLMSSGKDLDDSLREEPNTTSTEFIM